MASVYYLFDDAIHIADDIVNKYSQQDQNLQENHYAATVIQRSFRKHVAKKAYKGTVQAIIVLQKYVRGWLVRYHLPDILAEAYDSVCSQAYNVAATRIQAVWRGKMVRKEIDIKKLIKEQREASARLNELMGSYEFEMEPAFEDYKPEEPVLDEDEVPFGGAPLGTNSLLKSYIVKIMFDRHHLISTEIRKGVLDCNSQLKEVEKIMKTLPWKDYMADLRKLYYKYKKCKKSQGKTYLFGDKRMRVVEDLQRLRDKSHDVKEVQVVVQDFDTSDRKPFVLTTKLDKSLRYERNPLLEGVFIKPMTMITRTEDKTKNISDKDFVLALKGAAKECGLPPYYADFWYKDCVGHHIAE